MSDLAVFVDVLAPLRDWLRTQDIAGTVGDSVYAGGLPKNPTMPAVVVHRITSSVDGPLENIDLQFDVWHTTERDAAIVAAALVTLLATFGRVTFTPAGGVTVTFAGVDEDTLSNLPATPDDPTHPRSIVTCRGVFHAKPTP